MKKIVKEQNGLMVNLNTFFNKKNICFWGANFYVKANKYTQEFFEAIASKLSHWYTPDMGIMIHQVCDK